MSTLPVSHLGALESALDAIEKVAKQTLADDAQDALEAVQVIAVIIETLQLGLENRLTPDLVVAEIASLRRTIVDDVTDEVEFVDSKFDRS